MELTGEKGIWLMFYNFKRLFAYFQISEKYLINFKILMKYFNNNSKYGINYWISGLFLSTIVCCFYFFFVRLHFADKNIGLSFKCSVGFHTTTTTNNTYSVLRCFFNPSFLKRKVVD
jgi:hypothetical protein